MIVFGHDKEISTWVGDKLETEFFQSTAIGIARDGRLVAGVVYHNYKVQNIEMSIASTSPRWCTRSNLKTIFSYPFNQLNCKRVTAITDAGNSHTRQFLVRLGYTLEAVIRDGNPNDDAVIYSLYKDQCRWL